MKIEKSMVVAFVAALIAVAIGIVLSYVIKWFPVQASTQAIETDRLYHVLVIASIPIFVLVVTVVLYSVWRFRMRPGQELMDGPPIHGNTRLEVFWTAIPTVMLLGLVGYSFVVLHKNEKKPAREIQVGVMGQQFAWTYEYPSSITGGAPLHSTQLYLPKNESVDFNMNSRDVIHAFWIPAFRLQEDVVPGHHDALPRHTRPARLLPGRLQPALRPRPRPDALDRPRRSAGGLPRLAHGQMAATPGATATVTSTGITSG